jgi:Na+/proline symporter
MSLNLLDGIIIIIYLAGMIALSLFLARGQKNAGDHYPGGDKTGSLINGPLPAVFVMGMLSRRVNGQGAILGLLAGFLLNLCLWKYAPDIS